MNDKIFAGSLVAIVILALLLAGIAYHFYGPMRPQPAAASHVSQGFWKDISVTVGGENKKAPAFFCERDGTYQGHIVDSGNGWWTAYQHADVKSNFASAEFAKKYVEENLAECK
jgi:hypothetical protein